MVSAKKKKTKDFVLSKTGTSRYLISSLQYELRVIEKKKKKRKKKKGTRK